MSVDASPQMRVIRSFTSTNDYSEDVWEGELEVATKEEQDRLKELVGDANGKVTVSREISEKSYGKGGSMFVSVTLTVDQSHDGILGGLELAKYYAESTLAEQFEPFKQEIIRMVGNSS